MAIGNAETHGLSQAEFDTIECAMDRVRMPQLMCAIAQICQSKAEHVRSNWQDESLAKVWDKRGAHFEDWASRILFADD